MFSLRNTLANRQLPRGYNPNMGVAVLCGRRPVSITRLRNSPCPQSVVVHFKSLLPIDNNINQFIDTQFIAMQRLFAEGDVAVLRGTTEDLSGNPALAGLQALEVGVCTLTGGVTNEQFTLYANRNNVGENDVVVYVVQSMTNLGVGTTFLGCATLQFGRPSAAVIPLGRPPSAPLIPVNSDWLVAHEVGHVLGLTHVCQPPAIPCVAGHSDSLMFPNVTGITKVPPDLSNAENLIMQQSNLPNPCPPFPF
jgi:hypothetical protein